MSSLLYIISNLIIIVSTVILIAFGLKLIRSLNRESKLIGNIEYTDELFNRIDSIILVSVITVSNTMVNRLKNEKAFFQKEKEEAFEEAKNRIANIINTQDTQHIGAYIDNIDEWIDNRIEYYVRTLKTSNYV
ncbi:hypothetical protein F8154_07750 [Alkaliphilus pronyensis]|uniref:Uncharacterized protein n=1 Tax=Alkaliphilus pronyensis TaxID=1482732 RepID=A0A6I0F1N6_9FIRM|nr:hypothetical protein [Alkaliphilus pronyensis]KAB3534872.1 hypothetical protein F8154_07750 [Alkaliphilus pronyensis]